MKITIIPVCESKEIMKITKLYSDYDEYYDEKLYSTGNEDLDELLERAFCEGYEYAQREFGIIGKGINQMARNRAAGRIRNLRSGTGVVSKLANKIEPSLIGNREALLAGAKEAQKLYPKGQNVNPKNLKHLL